MMHDLLEERSFGNICIAGRMEQVPASLGLSASNEGCGMRQQQRRRHVVACRCSSRPRRGPLVVILAMAVAALAEPSRPR